MEYQVLSRRNLWLSRLSFLHELVLVPVIALLVVAGSLMNPNFLTTSNLVNNILVSSAVLGLLAIAESLLVISGVIDLSLESTVAIAPAIGAWIVLPAGKGGLGWEMAPIIGVLVTLMVGVIVGVTNGFLAAVLRLNAFIVTLAMLIVLRGIVLGISGGQTLAPLPEAFTWFGTAEVAGVSVQIWFFLVLGLMVGLFMKWVPTGSHIYALGGNEEAARASGVNVTRLRIGIFVAASLIAALAGLLLTGRIASVTASQGDGMIFMVFAATVIGGVKLEGGQGTIIGTMTGVVLLSLIQNLLVLANVPSFWIKATYGVIILVALVIGETQSKHSARVR